MAEAEHLTCDEREHTARVIVDFLHRTVIHHALWFAEVRHQLGPERAYDILEKAWPRSYNIQMRRLARRLGFEMRGDLPAPLRDLPNADLLALKEATAANWLANDGVWFQAVEAARGMVDAKRCNDSCWARFSPFEAWSIRRLLHLPERPGLEGLRRALGMRLYATINRQSIEADGERALLFRMNECRVQAARGRKGLPDYPCKSGGIVEYTTFAESIDDRIRTECLCCPPDEHPEEYICAWRFTLEEEEAGPRSPL